MENEALVDLKEEQESLKEEELKQKIEDLEDLFLTTNLGLIEIKKDLEDMKFKFGGIFPSSEFESKLSDLEKNIKILEDRILKLEKIYGEISDDFLKLTEFLKVKVEELDQTSERVKIINEKILSMEKNFSEEFLKIKEDLSKIFVRVKEIEERVLKPKGEKPLTEEKSLDELESVLEMGKRILEKLKKKEVS
ncbi:MAG: hypothetical protein QXP77_00465 [Candidatus Aenigmatarchaeota archaeon]